MFYLICRTCHEMHTRPAMGSVVVPPLVIFWSRCRKMEWVLHAPVVIGFHPDPPQVDRTCLQLAGVAHQPLPTGQVPTPASVDLRIRSRVLRFIIRRRRCRIGSVLLVPLRPVLNSLRLTTLQLLLRSSVPIWPVSGLTLHHSTTPLSVTVPAWE